MWESMRNFVQDNINWWTKNSYCKLRRSLTRWSRFYFALVNDFRFEGFNFLYVHLMRLSRFCQLGEDETTTAQDWTIHLKHLCDQGTEEDVIKAGLTDSQDYAYCDKRSDKMKTYCTDLKSQLLCTGINSSCFAHSGWTDHEHCVTQVLLMVYGYSITLKITTVPWLYQNSRSLHIFLSYRTIQAWQI